MTTMAALQAAEDSLQYDVCISDGWVELMPSYIVNDDVWNQVANTFTTPHGSSASVTHTTNVQSIQQHDSYVRNQTGYY